MYFKTETDVVQNLNDDFSFFSIFEEDLSIGRILSEKNMGVRVLISEKTDVLYTKLNEKAEAATSSYSAITDFLQYIYLRLWLRIIRRSNQGV